MKTTTGILLAVWMAACAGCVTPERSARPTSTQTAEVKADSLAEKDFLLEVLRHVYRWHFDHSYALEAGKVDHLEIWSRRLHPALDADDRSEYGELWIPAVKTRVELKRAEYTVPELKLEIADRNFKVKRVNRQLRAPASAREYQVTVLPLQEVQDYLFKTRSSRVPISDALRTQARNLIAAYLAKAHPAPFTEAQTFYVSPMSSVCNEVWVFWETGRKVMLFAADTDLSSAGFAQLSQLRLEVIDLDKDVVTSAREVPGSNAFVTKDWVGRLFYNCILFGEKITRTPEELRGLRATPSSTTGP